MQHQRHPRRRQLLRRHLPSGFGLKSRDQPLELVRILARVEPVPVAGDGDTVHVKRHSLSASRTIRSLSERG